MKKNVIKRVVSEALVCRGYSKAEAEQFIRRLAEPIKPQKQEVEVKTIDIYA